MSLKRSALFFFTLWLSVFSARAEEERGNLEILIPEDVIHIRELNDFIGNSNRQPLNLKQKRVYQSSEFHINVLAEITLCGQIQETRHPFTYEYNRSQTWTNPIENLFDGFMDEDHKNINPVTFLDIVKVQHAVKPYVFEGVDLKIEDIPLKSNSLENTYISDQWQEINYDLPESASCSSKIDFTVKLLRKKYSYSGLSLIGPSHSTDELIYTLKGRSYLKKVSSSKYKLTPFALIVQ